MNNLTTFYLVRHGETDWNKQKILQGHTDIPLNTTGEQQAKELGQTLKNVSFDLAFSSDLLRTKKTAELIILEKKLHVETTKLLREKTFGHLEAKPLDVFFAHTEVMRKMKKAERLKHRIAEGIESDEEVTTRLITFLRETAVAYPGKTVLVVTHSGLLRMFLLHAGHFTFEELDTFSMSNGAYVTFQSDGVDFFIKEVVGATPRKEHKKD
jgi:broad specificity phosphatase PhoE